MLYRDVAAFLITIALFLTLPSVSAAQKVRQLELFGVPLKGATRDQLRQALKQNGMRLISEDNYVSLYDPQGVLEGATEFMFRYIPSMKVGFPDEFAIAIYKFPAFMDTQLVEKVIKMVSTKYGRPSSRSGRYKVGPVEAIWNMGQGMRIKVERGWPDTTTYLSYYDQIAFNQMLADNAETKKAQERQKAKSQGNAF